MVGWKPYPAPVRDYLDRLAREKPANSDPLLVCLPREAYNRAVLAVFLGASRKGIVADHAVSALRDRATSQAIHRRLSLDQKLLFNRRFDLLWSYRFLQGIISNLDFLLLIPAWIALRDQIGTAAR